MTANPAVDVLANLTRGFHIGQCPPGSKRLTSNLITQIEHLIRRDPARRGLIGTEAAFGPLCLGHLGQAATHLAAQATSVAIVTGFFIPLATPPAAETDGPPGALLLGTLLRALGVSCTIITDSACAPVVSAAAVFHGFPQEDVLVISPEMGWESSSWVAEFFLSTAGRDLSHLIAIERVGPAHTPETLQQQQRTGDAPLEQFFREVPAESFGRCHNMRGTVIDKDTAPLHLLFEQLKKSCPEAVSIGIGDGGNEIGMGCLPWEELRRRLSGTDSARTPCRIPCDFNIIAGTSNWGGDALIAATLLLRGQVNLLEPYGREHHRRLLEYLVETACAVDGVTRNREPTVDGLPFLTYIQPREGIRRLLDLSDT